MQSYLLQNESQNLVIQTRFRTFVGMLKEREYVFSFAEFEHYRDLKEEDYQLIEQAHERLGNAYAPYSEFRVSVGLRLASGKIVFGTNQENLAYPSGLCAERVALFYSGSNYPADPVTTMVLVCEGDLIESSRVLSPCGACRQVMSETEQRQASPIRILLVARDGHGVVVASSSDLLPFSFSAD